MCEIGTLALVSGLLGSGVSAIGAVAQGSAAKDAADYQAQVDRNNAILANRQAQDAIQRGQAEQESQQRKNAALLGQQRAAFASRGVELGTGSPLDILADTAQFGELDVKTIRSNAEREGLGYEAKAMNFTADAGLQEMKGKSAQTAGLIGGAGSLLSGASSVASSWYKMK